MSSILARQMIVCQSGGVEFVLRRGQMIPVFDTGGHAMLVDDLAIHTTLVSVDEFGNPVPDVDGQVYDHRRYRAALERSTSSRAEAEFVAMVDRQFLGGATGTYVSRLHDLDPIIGLDPGCHANGGRPAWEAQALSYRAAMDLVAHFPSDTVPQRTWDVPCFYVAASYGGSFVGRDVMAGVFQAVVPISLPVLLRPLANYNRVMRATCTPDDVLNAVTRLVSRYPATKLYVGHGLLPTPFAEITDQTVSVAQWRTSPEAAKETVLLERGPEGNGFRYVARTGWSMLHDLLNGAGGGMRVAQPSAATVPEETEPVVDIDSRGQVELN